MHTERVRQPNGVHSQDGETLKVIIPKLYSWKRLDAFEESFLRNIEVLRESKLCETIHAKRRNGLSIDMARDISVADSILEYDAIIWMDTDMIYPDDAMLRLVQMHQAGYPIAAGIYRRAVGTKDLLTEIEEGVPATIEELDTLALEANPVKVEQTAGGFSIVSMDLYKAIFVRIGPPFYCNFDFRFKNEMCGEDRFFMRLARSLGVYPHVDPSLNAVHWPPETGPVPVRADDPLLKWTV